MSKKGAIYFVTVFYIPHDKLDNNDLLSRKEKPKGWQSHLYKRIRCWGWYKNEEDAEACIKENWTDIYEMGYYNFAIIEPFTEGPCGYCRETRYFTVDYLQNDKYDVKEIERPRLFKHLIGFSYA